MNNKWYCFCQIRRAVGDGRYVTEWTYLPERYAVVGKILSIKNKYWSGASGEWVDGWEVIYVGPKRAGEIVEASERDYLKQRGASDV